MRNPLCRLNALAILGLKDPHSMTFLLAPAIYRVSTRNPLQCQYSAYDLRIQLYDLDNV